MRLNKFIAQNTYLSRRQADEAIKSARVTINGVTAMIGDVVEQGDIVTLDNKVITQRSENITILLNKPVGYVSSRDGQGSPTVYDLLPKEYENLNIAGRLDKDSSGLVILTSNGDLLYELTHPSKNKEKLYVIETDKPLSDYEQKLLTEGVDIGDRRLSKFKSIVQTGPKKYEIKLEEGRNRQIRRSLDAIGRKTLSLRRTKMADYELSDIAQKQYKIL